ncbi:hypothetical protein RND81_03G044100 [Saponaria officinalis]|uniref:Uncharacterized protein n=1 Tax=Saponaria officinalis TaxID=3572 RepID=A0AAW1M3I4_SAPOF
MSNLAKHDFVVLDISGNNYLSWVLDAEIHLDANGLGETIKEGNTTTPKIRPKAMIFRRHHSCEWLKYEYLTVKNSLILWKNLKEMFDHLKTVILPKARYDWIHRRLPDFKSINDYNSAMFIITSQLTLCGEKVSDADMLEKTYQTFHGSQLLLSQQYRQRGFKKYSELISCLLVAEQNNKILLKNHQSRTTGTEPLLEVNVTKYENRNKGHVGIRDRGPREDLRDGSRDKNKDIINFFHRCGCKSHWARACRAPPHIVDSYHQSLNDNKRKKIEANFVAKQEKVETNFADINENQHFNNGDHLNVSDFFSDLNGRIDHLIGDGNVQASD